MDITKIPTPILRAELKAMKYHDDSETLLAELDRTAEIAKELLRRYDEYVRFRKEVIDHGS